ncbi:hypothetical protein [Blastococcus sp. SYSU D00820]
MTGKPVRCWLGFHSYVQRRPDDERPRGPDQKVCRLCGKQRDVPFGNLPGFGMGAGLGGGGL